MNDEQTEREAISVYLKQHNLRDYALFTVGVCAWYFLPILLSLNVGNVAYFNDKGKLNIAKSVTPPCKIAKKKTLSPEARRALAAYLKQRGKTAPITEADLNEPLFKCDRPRRAGDDKWRMTIQHAGHVLTAAARACGLSCPAGGQATLDYFTADLRQKELYEAMIRVKFGPERHMRKAKTAPDGPGPAQKSGEV